MTQQDKESFEKMKITTKMVVPKREELPDDETIQEIWTGLFGESMFGPNAISFPKAPVACCSWPNLIELKPPYNFRKRRKLLDRLIPE